MNFAPFRFLLPVAFLLGVNLHAAELISGIRGVGTVGGASSEPAIGNDGRYVAFSSLARLLPSDANFVSDVYLRDRVTGALFLVSDDRGGDQPAINADGRFTAFRALDVFPKVRLFDLVNPTELRTISYPYGGRSFRAGDLPAISPEGKFISFAFRPVPGFTNASDSQLTVVDRTSADPLNAADSITNNFNLDTLGRSAMKRDASRYFVQTNDAIASFDTNGAADIYLIDRNDNFVRVSATGDGLPETVGRGAYQPAVNARGDTVFFISDRRLRASDNDNRATIYFANSSNGFSIPQPLPTGAIVPVALSPQAAGTGEFLAFVGRAPDGNLRPYILRVSNRALLLLADGFVSGKGAPALASNNSRVAFATGSALSPNDGNGTEDVFTVPNPFSGGRVSTPVVTFSGLTSGQVITENVAISLSATATSPDGLFFTSLQVDGREIARSAGGAAQRNFAFTRGKHRVRGLAISNDGNVQGLSPVVEIDVRAAANTVRITGVTDLARARRRDGTISFSAKVNIDNNSAAARGMLQVAVVERPEVVTWEFFGDEDVVPPELERVLTLQEFPFLAANSPLVVGVRSLTARPFALGDGFQGSGSSVIVRLREMVGSNWVERDSAVVFQTAPRLNDDTPGANGGIPVLSPNTGGTQFNPTVLLDIQVIGPSQMAERTTANFGANLVFNTGNQPCRPRWDVINGGGVATISPAGVLTAGDVASPRNIAVRATFGTRSKNFALTIRPVSPVVSVAVPRRNANENGTAGVFRILRSQIENRPLVVNYTVAGSASPGQDYVALPGTVTIPAGQSSALVTVTPINDNFAEGQERVRLAITPAAGYRRGSASAANVFLDDDEPPLPDALVQAAGGPQIGAFMISFDNVEPQAAVLRRARDQVAIFACRFVNRTAATQNFTISGGSSFLGFGVRYFSGATDITALVTDGNFNVNGVAPGATVSISLRIAPTAQTPIGARLRCPVTLQASGNQDTVEAVVVRFR